RCSSFDLRPQAQSGPASIATRDRFPKRFLRLPCLRNRFWCCCPPLCSPLNVGFDGLLGGPSSSLSASSHGPPPHDSSASALTAGQRTALADSRGAAPSAAGAWRSCRRPWLSDQS